MDDIQCRSKEHEGELQRLGYAADECAQRACEEDTTGNLLLARLRSVIHCQSSTRQTEHHDREEAGHVHTGDAGSARAAPEIADIIDTSNIKPEHGVQCVVQANRDQQSVEEAVDTSADRTQADDCLAECNKCIVNNRPYKEEDQANYYANQCRHNSYRTLAAKEGQCLRKFRVLKTIVAKCTNNAADDADELVVCLGESSICFRPSQNCDDAGIQNLLDHQPGNQAGQRGCTFVIVAETNRNTDREQNGHVVNDRSTDFHQEESDDIRITKTGHNVGIDHVTNSHQDTCYRQAGNWKHQSFSKLLKLCKDLLHNFTSSKKLINSYKPGPFPGFYLNQAAAPSGAAPAQCLG